MPWPRPFLIALALASVTLWLTTAAVSAQSVGLPSAPQTPASPRKVDQVVHQAAQTAQPAVQAVKQAAAPVSQTAKQVTSTVSQTVKIAPRALPVTPPRPPISIAKAPTPVAEVVEPVVHEATAAVQQVVADVVSSVPDPAPQVVADVLSAMSDTAPVVANVLGDDPPAATSETLAEPVQVATPPVWRPVAAPIVSVRPQEVLEPAAEEPVAVSDDDPAAPTETDKQPDTVLPLGGAIVATTFSASSIDCSGRLSA